MAEQQSVQVQHASPTAWLWAAIEQRFGPEAAAELRQEFNAQMKAYVRRGRITTYQIEIDQLQEQLAEAQAAGAAEEELRRLRRKIAHRKRRLAQGWDVPR